MLTLGKWHKGSLPGSFGGAWRQRSGSLHLPDAKTSTRALSSGLCSWPCSSQGYLWRWRSSARPLPPCRVPCASSKVICYLDGCQQQHSAALSGSCRLPPLRAAERGLAIKT